MSAHLSSRPCPSTSTPPGATQLRLGCSAQPRAPFLLRPDEGALGGPPGPSGRGGAGQSCHLSRSRSGPRNSPPGSRRPLEARLLRRLHLALRPFHPQAQRASPAPPLQRSGLPTSVPLHEAPPAGASRLRCSASRAQFRCHLPRRLPLTPLRSPPGALTGWLFSSLFVWLPGEQLEGRQHRIHPCPQGPAQDLQLRQPCRVLKGQEQAPACSPGISEQSYLLLGRFSWLELPAPGNEPHS